jgi:uncharacterized membrane protein YcaP (DUF421 family)
MDIVIRASILFLFLFGLIRLMGKRELGQMAPFELVMLIVMGDLIQQAVTHQDFSITAAVLAVLTFAAWALAMNFLTDRFPRARRKLEGMPTVLVRAGRTLEANMRRQGVDEDELSSEMRIAGIASLDAVAWAILEPEGKISFIRSDGGEVENSDKGGHLGR